MEINKVKGNTFCIDTGMTYIPFYKINEKEIIILDTGWAKGEREGIEALLEENRLRISGILCSHAHIDHIGNNAYFKEKYKCCIAMPAYEAMICSSAVNLKLYYSNQTLSEVEEHLGHMVCETDIMIFEQQDNIFLCGIKFGIWHTPGHSPAHICITTPDQVAYLGDALISYEVMRGAKMPYAFILREDLKSKASLRSLHCSKYVVAHKGMYDDITQLIDDNIEFYQQRAQRIYQLIEDAMTMEDIFKAAIAALKIRITSKQRYRVIDKILRSYLEYLQETGKIELAMQDGSLKYSKCLNQ